MKHWQAYFDNVMQNLDSEAGTGCAQSNEVREIPKEVEALAAAYQECQHQLAPVYAKYEDRVETTRYRVSKWEQLYMRGEDQP